MKDYASKEGHSKVVNQLSMQKMSVMARTRSKENVLDDSDQIDEAQVQKNNEILNNQKAFDAQITEKEIKTTKSDVEINKIEKSTINTQEIKPLSDKIKIETINTKGVLTENKNVMLDSNINELKEQEICIKNNHNEKNNISNLTLENKIPSKINNSSIAPLKCNKEINDKNNLICEEKNISVNIPIKDEESVSQCTMPPPMDPPRSWDFIQTSIINNTVINEKTEKQPQESIEPIPDPIVCTVNADDSELEWGSDESLPTDPNQISPIVDKKEESKNKNKKTFYNFITTKLINKNKNRVSASADSIVDDGITTNKHVRNKSLTSLSTFKITDSSDVNKVLYQLSPEMNFAHSSFSKSKSFNEHIPENMDKNLEFERSKSLCLELKHNYDTSENQQRDSDSQSDDSLRSKRSLLLSMRMPKVHDEHHDDYHLEIKECETSEDEGPHYWYSPNKKNVKIVQQDTVIRNNSESEDSQ